MNKMLTYIIAALIIYVIIDNKITEKQNNRATHNQTREQSTDPDNAPSGNILEKSLSNLLVNVLKTPEGRTFFENMIQPKNQSTLGNDIGFKLNGTAIIEGLFKIQTYGEGTIGPASCGHVVHANYQILTMDNIIVEEARKTFRLGSNEIMPGLENVIIGMYIGQIRQAIIPAPFAYNKQLSEDKRPGLNYQIKVTLIDIIPKTFVTDVKIFDEEIAYKTPCLCGSRVSFDMLITKINGEIVYDSKAKKQKIQMALGNMSYPMIISHGLTGKIPVGNRTLIAKGKYFRSLGNEKSNSLFKEQQLPMDEYFLVEFSDIVNNEK